MNSDNNKLPDRHLLICHNLELFQNRNTCQLFNEFKYNRKSTVWSSFYKAFGELMSAYYEIQTLRTGNLPHLSHVKRKPQLLGDLNFSVQLIH